MSGSYLLRYYLRVIPYANVAFTDSVIAAPLYFSFLFFLSVNEYFYFVSTAVKLYKPDSSRGSGTSSRSNVVTFYCLRRQ